MLVGHMDKNFKNSTTAAGGAKIQKIVKQQEHLDYLQSFPRADKRYCVPCGW